MSESTKKDEIIAKRARSRSELALKRVNLAKVESQIRNIIARDVEKILRNSLDNQLNKDETAAVNSYLKTIVELQRKEKEMYDGMTEEELRALLAKNNAK